MIETLTLEKDHTDAIEQVDGKERFKNHEGIVNVDMISFTLMQVPDDLGLKKVSSEKWMIDDEDLRSQTTLKLRCSYMITFISWCHYGTYFFNGSRLVYECIYCWSW